MTASTVLRLGPPALVVLLATAGCSPPSGGDGDGGSDADLADSGSDGDLDADRDEPGDADRADADRDEEVPESGTCEPCEDHPECGLLSRCIQLTGGARVCTPTCEPDIPSCPLGFDCVHNFMAPDHTVCVPIGQACCLDEDEDGYGQGIGCRGPDCDDDDPSRNPGADELCNGRDDDCDELVDGEVVDCGDQQCGGTASGLYEETEPGECVAARCSERRTTACGLFTCGRGEGLEHRCATSCLDELGEEDDLLCIRPAHCDLGLCEPDEPNGEVCDEDSDCVSGHCDNGFCCDDGVCCAVREDCPGAGSVTTVCESYSTCQGSRGEVLCTDSRCVTRDGIPDDSACGPSIEADTCGYFLSVHCTGEVDQAVPRCPTVCSADAECDPTAHCDYGTCLPDLPNGEPCDEDSDCISEHCESNICCDAGECCRSPSDCPPGFGSPPTCDSPSTCQGTRDAATCMGFECGTAFDVPDDSACGAGLVASTCGLYPSVFCTGAEAQSPPVCATSCSSDSECDEPAHCDLSACVPDLPDGSACDEDSDCVSAHCQNGRCCAAGDCCAVAADCPLALYGEPSVCLAASTCQGQRRDPACSDSMCRLGGLVDDDSGCAGLTSNDCGHYPAVTCTSAVSQSPDQAALCATSCTTDLQCDPGAHCSGGLCVADGEQGDPCTLTTECASGLQCVDGVCCTSSCTGTCRACNVAGHRGECWNVPGGTDPAGECAGFSCAGYYWGWSGDSCYRRADAPASGVDCDGTGRCETQAMVCPGQGQGPSTLTCHSTCQDPNTSTCAGTTAGVCDDVNPGDQSCGVGACRRTVAQCSGGAPVTCVPGSPTAETCNNIDDDCNGTIDDNVSGAPDVYEPNPSCASYRWLGNVAEESSEVSWSATIYPSGDEDFYRFQAVEGTHTCFPGTGQTYRVRLRLVPPSGTDCRDYDLQLLNDSCGVLGSSTVGGCTEDSITYSWSGTCGFDDSRYFRVRVYGFAGAWECAPYRLYIDMWQA